jgi:hypothetical protein
MDNDFPSRMAGERLQLTPLDIREGLKNGSLAEERALMRAPRAELPWNPMAPEKSWPGYALSGSPEPPETYGA